MKTNNWVKLVVVPCLAISAILTGCTGQQSSTSAETTKEKEVTFGVIAPMSGAAASYGEDAVKMFSYAEKEFNSKPNRPFKLKIVFEDGKGKGPDAVSAFQKLVDVDKVKYILPFTSSETFAVSSLAEPKNVLVVSSAATASRLHDASNFVFTFGYDANIVGRTMVQDIASGKKIAILTEENEPNIDARNAIVSEVKKRGDITIVYDELYPKGQNDVRGNLQKLFAAQPDIIVISPNIGVTAKKVLEQYAELKGEKNYELIGIISNLSDDSRSTVPASVVENMKIYAAPNLTNSDMTQLMQGMAAYKGEPKNLGAYYAAASVDAVNMITSYIATYGDDPRVIQDKMRTLPFNGYLSDTLQFTEKGGFLKDTPEGKYVVKNGKAILQTQ